MPDYTVKLSCDTLGASSNAFLNATTRIEHAMLAKFCIICGEEIDINGPSYHASCLAKLEINDIDAWSNFELNYLRKKDAARLKDVVHSKDGVLVVKAKKRRIVDVKIDEYVDKVIDELKKKITDPNYRGRIYYLPGFVSLTERQVFLHWYRHQIVWEEIRERIKNLLLSRAQSDLSRNQEKKTLYKEVLTIILMKITQGEFTKNNIDIYIEVKIFGLPITEAAVRWGCTEEVAKQKIRRLHKKIIKIIVGGRVAL